MQKDTDQRVVIIGAGLTGLSTAHYLKKAGIPFRVIDRNPRPGGVIRTRYENGFVFEQGPNTGVIASGEIAEMFEELGDFCELETASEKATKRYILKNGKWEALPSGLIAGIKTPLFTLRDKFRLLGEPFRSRGKDPDETLALLVKRRMGQSFLDYAVDPFIIGIYAGDPEILVPRYALPKLYNLEQKYGSFIGGAIKKQFEKKSQTEKKISRKVFSVKGGLSNLVQALYKNAGEQNVDLGINNLVVEPLSSESNYQYQLNWEHQGTKHSVHANNVVFTGGSFELPKVFSFISAKEMGNMTNLRYARIIEVSLGFNQWQGIPLDGFGGLIPSREKRDILGVLYMSTLFEGRAPEGGALLTVFMGGIRNTELTTLPDDVISLIIEREIKDLMGLDSFSPDLFKITRYDYAIPQYEASSGSRLETINQIQQRYIGLFLGGNMRDGIGMADRVKQGKMLADQIISLHG